jgi:hypothetical protein
MRCVLLLAILVFATTAAAAEPATVTGRKDGTDLSYKDGRDTIGLGMAVAVFGSAKLEFAATKERWEAARRRDHIRVQFSKPATLAAQLVDPEGKRYAVDEILVRTKPEDVPPAARDPQADWGSSDVLMAGAATGTIRSPSMRARCCGRSSNGSDRHRESMSEYRWSGRTSRSSRRRPRYWILELYGLIARPPLSGVFGHRGGHC